MMILATIEASSRRARAVDDELILKIATGDMDAFHRLYEALHSNIYGYSLSITQNTHDAQDVLQETFIAVFDNAPQYEPMGKPLAWILTIARNLSYMKLRARGNAPLGEEQLEGLSSQLDELERAEERELLKLLLKELKEDERQIVMLHASGFKNREIASFMDMPLGSTLSKYHRAIEKLRKKAEEGGF